MDALLLKYLEELIQEYMDPKTIELNKHLDEASEEMIELFPHLESEVLLNCKPPPLILSISMYLLCI